MSVPPAGRWSSRGTHDVERVVEQAFVVRADVKHDRERLGGVHAADKPTFVRQALMMNARVAYV
jgi:hypothetical protein